MKELFKSSKFKTLITALIVIILISFISYVVGGNPLSSLINGATRGLSKVAAAGSDKLNKKTYDELLEENEKLTDENTQLKSQIVDYYNVLQENERLWKYYDLKKDNPNYKLMPASVIRRDPNDDFYSFTIDKGTGDGVSVNDAVITDKGVVGRVYRCDVSTSKIKTVLSPDTSISVIGLSKKYSGIITGNALYSDKNQTTLTKISDASKVSKGDIITTSGIGGVYPANLIVGEVTELKRDTYDTSVYAVVKPYEDITQVLDVVVITDFSGKSTALDSSSPTEANDE